ncbi:unnamed protein product [Allacma fusca]|uniref:Uncharacterized protein n=1 Tax=Allacma fusca TaxID=39272 RepID=A0A8J2PSR9_9HEXA|nr:unnamed protein product [Allacma fusca]
MQFLSSPELVPEEQKGMQNKAFGPMFILVLHHLFLVDGSFLCPNFSRENIRRYSSYWISLFYYQEIATCSMSIPYSCTPGMKSPVWDRFLTQTCKSSAGWAGE